MSLKKIAAGFILPFLLTSFLCSQSVVELAKNEKQRRTNLRRQGKSGKIVTIAELKNLKRGAALTTTLSLSNNSRIQNVTNPPRKTQAEEAVTAEEEKMEGLLKRQAQLNKQWEKAKEDVNTLSRKLNTLWKQFYSMDDLSARENVQREISTTSQQLQTAKGEETRIRGELRKVIASLRKIGN